MLHILADALLLATMQYSRMEARQGDEKGPQEQSLTDLKRRRREGWCGRAYQWLGAR